VDAPGHEKTFMNVPVFLDTNVLLYADDNVDPDKRERARNLIREIVRDRNGRISLQVLQEYFSAATRKLGIDSATARKKSRTVCAARRGQTRAN